MPHVKKVHCRPKKSKKNLVHTSLKKKTTSILQFTLVIKKQKSPSLSKRAASFLFLIKKNTKNNLMITQKSEEK